jgi:SAM-dependent methyltransferase
MLTLAALSGKGRPASAASSQVQIGSAAEHGRQPLTARATSFGVIADQYNRLKASSPPEAVDWLLPTGAELVVDLAAGTGLLSRAIPATVVAVEPDIRMGAVLASNSPGVPVVAGVGEAIPLADGVADAVLISCAWHWMDPRRAVPEIGRVLRDGGRFGLIWTSRDREVNWIRRIDRLREPSAADAPSPAPRHRNRDVVLPNPNPFTDVETASFTFTKTVPIDEFAPMIGTYSRIIIASEEERAEILRRVRAAVQAQFPGEAEIVLPMRSLCWRATRRDR